MAAEGSQQVRRLSSQQLRHYTPTPSGPGAGEEKYKPQTREQEGSRHYIPTAPHSPKARAQLCVIQPTPTSSGAMPHIFTSEIEPTYKYGNLVRVVLALDRGRPKLTVKRSNICTDKPLKTM